jgi:hypothetical protein
MGFADGPILFFDLFMGLSFIIACTTQRLFSYPNIHRTGNRLILHKRGIARKNKNLGKKRISQNNLQVQGFRPTQNPRWILGKGILIFPEAHSMCLLSSVAYGVPKHFPGNSRRRRNNLIMQCARTAHVEDCNVKRSQNS